MKYNIRVLNSKQVIKDTAEIRKVAAKGSYKAMLFITSWLVGVVQHEYLRGGPGRLNVRTGRLRNSITSGVSVKKEGVYGAIGTNVLAPNGFNYPAYWEFYGHNGVPRPFITPAINDNRNAILDKYKRIVREELIKWARAKKY